MLSRVHAAERAGLTKIPAIVKEMTNDDAIIAMVDSNLQREEIHDLIIETVLSQSESIVIASNRYPTDLVRGKFLKLNASHIEYVMDCLKGNTTKVKNIKKYLLAALFNAPTTISGYYQAEVNHDFPQYARAK